MRYISLKDRIADKLSDIADRLGLSKQSWAHIGIAAGVAILISGIIIITVVPGNADITRLDDAIDDINDVLAHSSFATDDDLAGLGDELDAYADNITRRETWSAYIEDWIGAIQVDIDSLVCLPWKPYLTGVYGNYTLHLESSEAGIFTANVNLIYSPPMCVNNATNQTAALGAFYSGINWTAPGIQAYVPTAAYNGTSWVITETSFFIAPFTLEINTPTTIEILCAGLDYKPSFAYVEIYRVLK